MTNSSNSNLHLTLEERRIIQTAIKNGATKSSIAITLGKDKSTIGKEIKKHRILKHRCNMPLECNNYRKCVYGRNCTIDCPDFVLFKCTRRDRSPGACNGCSKNSSCRFNKYSYEPEIAYSDYREMLVDSRVGFNLTTSEAKRIAEIVSPLLKQGLSPYTIIHNHPELGICEKTLYNYIENGVFQIFTGVSSMDLRRQVSRKIPKKHSQAYKKREDRKYLVGRTYSDYSEYMSSNPNSSVVQMDTVYNNESTGPFIQTFKFLNCGVLFAVLHKEKTSENMVNGINLLNNVLGNEIFNEYVNVILTDRGSEFSNADAIEKTEDNILRTRVFYCDPMRSNQKGSLENKHIELRYICPKGTELYKLGLNTQDKLNLALSHINSAPLEKLRGKSPLDLAKFLFPELYEKFVEYGIHQIPYNKIVLKPYLIK